MPDIDFNSLSQLGGTVVVVALFIWYLTNKNGKAERAMKEVTDALKGIHNAQDTHTRVLIKVAENSGLRESAGDLMRQ